jgi:hypothetical protein
MLVVERERFEHARKQITSKGRDAMAAPGDKGKGKGTGKTSASPNATDGWWMKDGKDIRADRPCQFFPAGTCLKGKDCPYSHTKKAKGVDSAAAPSGEPAKKGKQQVCRSFLETGKCRFGAACSYLHESPKGKPDKPSEKGGKPGAKSAGKKFDPKAKKKGRPGAVAEIASGSEASYVEFSEDELSSEYEDQD